MLWTMSSIKLNFLKRKIEKSSELMKKINIYFIDIEDALYCYEDVFDAFHFLDVNSGEVIYMTSDLLSLFEKHGDAGKNDICDWQLDCFEYAKKISTDVSGRYIKIPTLDSYEAYKIMQNFVYTIEDENLREKLEDAIDGRGVFQRFRNVLEKHSNIKDKWYFFRKEEIKKEVNRWLSNYNLFPVYMERQK